MNELSTQTTQLPSTLPELSKFVLVGREKLAAVKAEINAIKKVGLAKEVLEQKKIEAQEIAELVTLSEVRIGQMLREIPKVSGGDRKSESFKNFHKESFEKNNSTESLEWEHPQENISEEYPLSECEAGRGAPLNDPVEVAEQSDWSGEPEVESPRTKTEVIKDLGFSPKQAHQFQQMAENEDVVRKVISEARENDDVVSRSAVLKEIDRKKREERAKNPIGSRKFIDGLKQDLGRIQAAKAEKTVSIKDLQEERENRRLIARNMYVQCLKLGRPALSFFLGAESCGLSVADMVAELDDAERQRLCEYLSGWVEQLYEIWKAVKGL